MKTVLIQKLCRCLQTPALTKGYMDAAIGLVLIVFTQLLVVPIQITLDLHSVNLPASILVMLLVLITMTIASSVKNTEKFYFKHLRGPTDFLGRHMSFGFVPYFVLLLRDHINTSSDVPKLAGAFTATIIMSYLASFLCASGACQLEQRFRRSKQAASDLESNNKTWPSPSIAWPAPPCDRQSKRLSQLSTLSEALSAKGELEKATLASDDSAAASIEFILRTAPIWIWLFLLVSVGLPTYLATRYVMPFEVFAFTLFWVLSIQIQRSLKTSNILFPFRRLKSVVVIFTNPIVITWALASAYIWVKTSYTGKSVATTIGEFRHYNSLSQSILHIVHSHDVAAHLGAGDLAGLLLDAGVASMGFKMYEFRSELWAVLGTVSSTCATLAVINVFLNVLVAYAFGLQADEATAFAARSATLALGIPAIQNLGGSTTLTSALAIFNGILFQMTGDWLFSLLRIDDRVSQEASTPPRKTSVQPGKRASSYVTATVESADMQHVKNGRDGINEDSAVIAAGITVGINSAAMGTSYLIEQESRAAAYSALSMIMFGAATVALTALPGVAEAIKLITSK